MINGNNITIKKQSRFSSKWFHHLLFLLVSIILIPLFHFGCISHPQKRDLDAVSYTPFFGSDWQVSTPAEQGLDSMLVSKLYDDAAKLETLYGLLVIKNGVLIAEGYFNKGSVDQLSGRQSATKSVTSALVGVALDQGYLSSVDQKMMDFFPEFSGQITDPRKREITIRDLLQMRAGYPDEERTPPYFEILFFQNNWHLLPHLVDFPLTRDPGTTFQYSNLTSHILGAIVARASDRTLLSLAQEYLFSPIDASVGSWTADADNYNLGCSEIHMTARDMARFGQLYLDKGEYQGKQILSANWVKASHKKYSEQIKVGGWLTSRYGSFKNLEYGYQWWSAEAGKHRFDFALGHGGNYIILLHDLDMVIVTTADPLHDLWGENPWRYEGAINKVIGRFIKSLPNEI